jgi:multicomponent Na+:H+ antiporter subunit C
MIWTVALSAGTLVAGGVYLALSRDLLRTVVGVSLLSAGANLVVFSAGRLGPALPAFVAPGASALAEGTANPLPQALVLTAIVIGFSLTCFSLVLVLSIWHKVGVFDSAALRIAEPLPDEIGNPRPLVEEP